MTRSSMSGGGSARSAGTTRGRRSQLARAVVLALALAAVGALGVIASGCGGSSGEGVAQVDTTTSTGEAPTPNSDSGDPAAYAACMRRNGVPEFPDPPANGPIRVDKDVQGSPRYRAAASACRELLPSPNPSQQQLAEALRQAVRYAACIRAHGVPEFPDPVPNAQGNGFDFGGQADEDSPRFRAAARACIELGRGAKNALVGR